MKNYIILLLFISAMAANAATNFIKLNGEVRTAIITNIVETTNEKGCSACYNIENKHWLLYHPRGDKCFETYQPATEKTQVISIVSNVFVFIQFNKKEYVIQEDYVLKSITNRFVLSQVWNSVSNLPAKPETFFMPTNFTFNVSTNKSILEIVPTNKISGW